ncbi:hypothetical protein EcWSU1_02633 [Enterobacter ludwigii]|uniref:Uncharacterized protein n=1 Tax=Enterobacter ludwigii TaxID=299767 RepID=G8LF84_9ENTR|nr:hypothetical protein EcWSU1_02633 [Enterobacter ludwigii]
MAGIQLVETLHQIVNRLDLFQERLQFSQRQCGRAVALRVVRVRVCFNEQTGQASRHTGARQLGDLRTAAARSCTKRVAALQRMGHIEDDRRLVGHVLHHAEAEHINDQVVVTEVCATVTQDHFVVAAFDKFIDDVTHLARAHELRFLHVDDRAGFRHRFHQVRLTRQERRQLDNVDNVRNRLRLRSFVHVGDHFHAKGLFQFLENFHPLFQARATVRVNGGTVGFVKRGLKHVRDTQFLGHGHVVLADTHREITGFQHVHTAKQHERQVVCHVDITNANHFLFHRIALFRCESELRLMQCNLFVRDRVDLRTNHFADRVFRALLNEIIQIVQRHMLAIKLGINQPAIADFVRIFRIKLQQHFAGT